MLTAAVKGAIDFSQARIRDPNWWRYVRLVLDELSREREIEYTRMQLDRVRSLTARANLTDFSRQQLADQADRLANQVWKLWFPWLADASPHQSPADMRQAWINAWGDPNDPEVAKAIDMTVAMLDAGNNSRR